MAELEAENLKLKARRAAEAGMHGIFGQCPQMEGVFATIRKVSSVDVPVLILGESGTGKEMVARAIHDSSLRKGGAFIPINCGAIPENLLEAELFGHEKGAFTGAHTRVQGKVEYADGGTLFLDEIGEMPPLLQVKLLRFLQEQVFQRVGGREDVRVNARIVAATNTDIEACIASGAFREDLYYRLGVVVIQLPPLRERGDDILLLANLFLRRYATEYKKKIRCFSTEALAHLRNYAWPGNVRELENKVKRASGHVRHADHRTTGSRFQSGRGARLRDSEGRPSALQCRPTRLEGSQGCGGKSHARQGPGPVRRQRYAGSQGPRREPADPVRPDEKARIFC